MGTNTRISGCQTLIACLLLTAAAPHGAHAQAKPPAATKSPITIAAPVGQMPDAYKLSMLIRTTLIGLSQANQTGNYSVLRDLATPQFQGMNNDAQLADVFKGLRGRAIDFSPVLFFDPQLVRQPAFEGNLLRLTGFIPTKPQRIVFDMGFEQIGPDWRLAAIVIDVQDTPADTAAQQPDNDAPATAKPSQKPKDEAKPATKPN